MIEARQRSEDFRLTADAVDRADGTVTPQSLLVVESLLAAVETKDWSCVFDALAYLQN